MTRRRNGWDYRAPGRYMVTLSLADRTRPWLNGALGRLVDAKWREIALACERACALNRIAQAIARDGAAEIDYKGLAPLAAGACALAAVKGAGSANLH